ncbi:hypothetical protein [Shewanella xiamenensis]|uniref:hypothetical protein n=1 Tax=Shewanella xiamenensis TaxID=332186 RepID=UPI0021B49500|nr:hypothetical protein [Shewanella xiamenensis]
MDNKLCFSKFSETMVQLSNWCAICVDKSHPWYGMIFFKDPGDCSWVSKRKATPLEMEHATSLKAMIDSSTQENQLTDNSRKKSCSDIPYTPEEDAEFARIERNQDIALLANVIRSSPTTSAEAIAARVLDAGYQFSGSAVRLK